MQKADFFEGIPQVKAPWGNSTIDVPIFYTDMRNLVVFLLAPLKAVRSTLPSQRMHPLRVTPWHSVVAISAYEYKNSSIGPYNEVSIGVPFVLDKISPILTGIVRKAPENPMVYISHLPVTTEIARTAGIELANFPKFLANITFQVRNDWIVCEVNAEGKNILTLTGRKIKVRSTPRQRMYPITSLKGHLLRLELVSSECEMGISRRQSDARLELGNHQISQELRDLHLGRILQYQYCPARQSILTPVCESFALQPH